jgi:hypothetical protein
MALPRSEAAPYYTVAWGALHVRRINYKHNNTKELGQDMKHQSLMAIASVFLFGLFMASPAEARHPSITATAVCESTGSLVINYTASANGAYTHSNIKIFLNGSHVYTGAFAGPQYSFSGTLAAPSGTSATIGLLADGPWISGGEGGQSSEVTVTYPESCVQSGFGRFTGGGHQIRVDGVRVTRGLTIHCDLLLSNNLEINWGGNQFHMTEHMLTTQCSDDPNIVQFPPDAPLDTLIGVGTGRYNGADGFTVEFTLVDYGEPGSLDQMAIRVFETANPSNVVLNVPQQLLAGGNLQAHYDQPHR